MMTRIIKPKPPLGKIKVLHQAIIEDGVCIYCAKPMSKWKPMEECPEKFEAIWLIGGYNE